MAGLASLAVAATSVLTFTGTAVADPASAPAGAAADSGRGKGTVSSVDPLRTAELLSPRSAAARSVASGDVLEMPESSPSCGSTGTTPTTPPTPPACSPTPTSRLG